MPEQIPKSTILKCRHFVQKYPHAIEALEETDRETIEAIKRTAGMDV